MVPDGWGSRRILSKPEKGKVKWGGVGGQYEVVWGVLFCPALTKYGEAKRPR